jgi:serine/threonine protein kinase
VIELSKLALQSQSISPLELPTSFTVIPGNDLIPDTSFAVQRGSFGEVSKCIWKGTHVAVKKMFIIDGKKFVQEAQMMNTIKLPNCVRLYGACTVPYQAIVMEWMGGGDLSQFLAQRPLPKMHRRLSLFRQICAGLNSLHSHSPDPIIHADLKPANILLNTDQTVAKLADFGLSKIKTASYAGSASHAGIVGTVLYLAPEMLLKGVPPHRPTDIYAMGLIFWEILAGKIVWQNADGSPLFIGQIVAKYNSHERPSLDEIPAGVDRAAIALMQECWAEDPQLRPTADQLWRRMAALDPNNPENNNPLELFPLNFMPVCDSLENCLLIAMPLDVFNGLLSDMPFINIKYQDAVAKGFIRRHNLTEVEAKCVIMFTHESHSVPDHPAPVDPTRPKRDNQLYFLFNKACRERDAAALQRFQNFSFHFTSALQKLPNFQLLPGQNLYRGFGQRLEDMNDLYQKGRNVWWHYTSSSSLHREVAYHDFARKSGTLMEISCHNAKDIQELSMMPSEGELLFPPNIEFEVKFALSCHDARLLNARYAAIPDNVDLVILEAVPPRPFPAATLTLPVLHTGGATSAAV